MTMTDKEIRELIREMTADIKDYIKETVKPISKDLEYMEKRIFKGNGGKPLAIQVSENTTKISNLEDTAERIEKSVARMEKIMTDLVGETRLNSDFRRTAIKVINRVAASILTLAVLGGIYFMFIYKGGML